MTNSSKGVIGSIFTFILGILVGFVLLIGGIAGGAYWAYSNLKLSKINDYSKMQIIGDEYLNSTIKQLVDEISADPSSLTLGKLEEIFSIVDKTITDKYPDGIIPIKLKDVTFVEIDLNYLKTLALNSLSANATSAINFVATLEALTTVGIDLPDLPLINGGDAENPVDVYTLATDDAFAVTKNYTDYTEFYTVKPYTLASDETTGAIDPLYKSYSKFYIFDGTNYVLASNETTGEILPDYFTETSFYIEKDAYSLADSAAEGTEDLYVKTNGIINLPILDAFNGLTSILDFDSLSLRDLENKLGVNLKDTEGNYNFVLESILDVPINKMSTQITEEIQNFKLIDVIGESTNPLLTSLCYENDGITPVTVGGISARLDDMTLGQMIEIDPLTSPKILVTLQGSTLNTLSAKISDLTLDDVMTPTGALANLTDKRDTNGDKIQATEENTGDPLYYTDENKTATSTTVSDYPVYVKTKITEIDGQINYLKIGEFLSVGDSSSAILKALQYTQIQNLDSKIKTLTLQEIFAENIYDGKESVKAIGADTLDYTKYGFKKIYTYDGSNYTEISAFNTDHTFNTAYTGMELFSDKVGSSMWKFFVMDGGVEQEVILLEMGTRMTQIATNIRTANLYELKANGLITTDITVLDKPVTGTTSTIGDYTMEGLIALMASMV